MCTEKNKTINSLHKKGPATDGPATAWAAGADTDSIAAGADTGSIAAGL